MKKKNIICNSVIILSVALLTLVLFCLNHNMGNISDTSYLTDFMDTNKNINEENKGKTLSDMQLKYGMLSFFVKDRDKPILIFRLKETHCNLCVDKGLEVLNKLCVDSANVNNILVLGSFSQDRNLTIALRKNKSKIMSFNVPPDAISLDAAEIYETPYFFLLHPDMHVSDFYLTDNAFPVQTTQYLKNMFQLMNEMGEN